MTMAKTKQPEPSYPLFDWIERSVSADRKRTNPTRWKAARAVPQSQFPGKDIDIEFDEERLRGLQSAVYIVMKDGKYRTFSEIKSETKKGSETGIAATLRGFRHKSRGAHIVNKRRRGDPKKGVWEYQLIVNKKTQARTYMK